MERYCLVGVISNASINRLHDGNQIPLYCYGQFIMECQAHWIFNGRPLFHYINILLYEGRPQCEEQYYIVVISCNCIVASILEVAVVVYLY